MSGMVASGRAAAGADYVVDMQVLRAYADSSYLVASQLHSDKTRAPFLHHFWTCDVPALALHCIGALLLWSTASLQGTLTWNASYHHCSSTLTRASDRECLHDSIVLSLLRRKDGLAIRQSHYSLLPGWTLVSFSRMQYTESAHMPFSTWMPLPSADSHDLPSNRP